MLTYFLKRWLCKEQDKEAQITQIQEIMYNNDSTLTCSAKAVELSVARSIKLGRNSLRFSKNFIEDIVDMQKKTEAAGYSSSIEN